MVSSLSVADTLIKIRVFLKIKTLSCPVGGEDGILPKKHYRGEQELRIRYEDNLREL